MIIRRFLQKLGTLRPRPWISTIDRYVLRRFLEIYAANLLSFTSIFVVVDTLLQPEKFFRASDGLLGAIGLWARYYAALVPVIFCQILGPVITVSAALFAVTTTQRNNEFTPVLATGRSYQRTLLPIILGSLAISAGVLLVQEAWVPRTATALRRIKETLEREAIEQNVKHFDRVQGELIVFKEYEPYQRRGSGVLVLPVFSTGAHRYLIHARSAEWRAPEKTEKGGPAGYWLLSDGSVQEWDGDWRLVIHAPPSEWPDGSPRLYVPFAERKLETNLIPQDLESKETVHMTLSDLLRKAETSADKATWLIRYYSRFGYAATNFTLVLLGLPVIVFFASRNLIFGALLALGISTSYFVVNSIFQDLGIQGRIPASLAGGLAPILFVSLGATLYRGMKS